MGIMGWRFPGEFFGLTGTLQAGKYEEERRGGGFIRDTHRTGSFWQGEESETRDWPGAGLRWAWSVWRLGAPHTVPR